MSSKLNVIFMGTPDFAAVCLQSLIDNHNVVAVFTQTDKKQGRKQILTPPPVKVLALKNGIDVYQPGSLKDGAATAILEKYKPDIIVVAAYGKLLPEYVLNYPKYGCINVHGSILPKYRGAAPVQWSIINGDEETGVTLMYMSKGLDCGDIIDVSKTQIGLYETYGELLDRLAHLGAKQLIETMQKIADGTASRIKQDDSKATKAPMLDKSMAEIDFTKPAKSVVKHICGLNPWPVAYTHFGDKKLKVYSAKIGDKTDEKPATAYENSTKDGIVVACGENTSVILEQIQLEGNKIMPAKAFLAGHPITEKSFLRRA